MAQLVDRGMVALRSRLLTADMAETLVAVFQQERERLAKPRKEVDRKAGRRVTAIETELATLSSTSRPEWSAARSCWKGRPRSPERGHLSYPTRP